MFLRTKQPYKVCNNLHKQIVCKLRPIDLELINKEEENLAKKSQYNIRSLDLDQIEFMVGNNQCIVIEEEEATPPTNNPPMPTPMAPKKNYQSNPRKGSSVTFPNLIDT